MLRELMRFALLAALTLAAYSNHFENSFPLDDFHTIVENARVHSLHAIPCSSSAIPLRSACSLRTRSSAPLSASR